MKVYHYLSFTISLIFLVMGILIFSGVFSASGYFRNNSTLQFGFGAVLVLYGLFRGVNTYFKLKNPGNSRD